MARSMGLNLIGCSIVVMAFVFSATEATVYNVGDSFGWNTPTNESFYSDWASNKEFFVGDKLIFNWTGTHTVGDVSKADYDNCNTSFTSPFGGSGGRTVFQLTLVKSGPRFFICTIGNHCVRGQKFSINVESPNSDAPSAQSPDSSAPIQSFGIFASFLSSLAVYFLTRTY